MAEPAGLRHGPVVPQIEARLRTALDARRWDVGARLPNELALAGEFGVGRSSIREAVRLLVRDGLLEVRQGSGTYVVAHRVAGADVAAALRRARLLEVYEVRRSLEVEAARLAAQRATPAQLDGLRELLRQRQDLADAEPAAFVAADLRLHRAVVEAAGNPLLAQVFTMVLPVVEAALVDRISEDGGLPDTGGEHDELVAAIARGDAPGAVAATADNLDRTMAALRAAAD